MISTNKFFLHGAALVAMSLAFVSSAAVPSHEIAPSKGGGDAQAGAEESPPAAEANTTDESQSTDMRGRLCKKPPITPIAAALEALPRTVKDVQIIARVKMRYTAEGDVTSTEIVQSSGYPVIDTAIRVWALDLKMCPGAEAGEGTMPVEFNL